MTQANGQCPVFKTWAEYDAWHQTRAAMRDRAWAAEHDRIAAEGFSGFGTNEGASPDQADDGKMPGPTGSIAPLWYGRGPKGLHG